jgi:hypothetical protein
MAAWEGPGARSESAFSLADDELAAGVEYKHANSTVLSFGAIVVIISRDSEKRKFCLS